MSPCCGEFSNLLEFGPMVWQLGGDFLVFILGFQGFMSHPFSCFSGRVSFSGCLVCSLATIFMPPH